MIIHYYDRQNCTLELSFKRLGLQKLSLVCVGSHYIVNVLPCGCLLQNVSGAQSAVSVLSREYYCSVMMCFYSVSFIPKGKNLAHNSAACWFTSPEML